MTLLTDRYRPLAVSSKPPVVMLESEPFCPSGQVARVAGQHLQPGSVGGAGLRATRMFRLLLWEKASRALMTCRGALPNGSACR